MKKFLFQITLVTSLLAVLSSCDVKVDPDKDYDLVFSQDGPNISVSTKSIPEAGEAVTCQIHALLSIFSYDCDTENIEDDLYYCAGDYRRIGYAAPYPLHKDLKGAADENKTFPVVKMTERLDPSYGSTLIAKDYSSFDAMIMCYTEEYTSIFVPPTVKIKYKKTVTFSPDLNFAIPAPSQYYEFSNKTSTSVRVTFSTLSYVTTGARLQRSLDNTNWTTIATLTNKIKSNQGTRTIYYFEAYDDVGLSPATTYYYRAVNFNNSIDAETIISSSVTTLSSGGGGGSAPAAPTGLASAGATSSTIDLSWTDNSNNETGFEVDRSPNGTSSWVTVTTTAADATTYSDTGLSASTTYYYRVRAVNSSGNSSYTSVVNDTTAAGGGGCMAPADPMNLNLFLIGMTQINLTWSDFAMDETGFVVERSTVGAGGPFSVLATLGANITTYSDMGLSAGTTYYYRVKAIKSGCSDSGYTAVQSQATPGGGGGGGPTAPSSATAFPDVGAPPEITITWQDNSMDETGFEIERSTTSGSGFTLIHTTSADEISYNDNTALAGTTYYYRVRAVNVSGNSAYTSEAMVVNP